MIKQKLKVNNGLAVGDIKDVKIISLGKSGDGVAKIDNFVIFVPNTKVDDTVTVKILRLLPKFGFAEVYE